MKDFWNLPQIGIYEDMHMASPEAIRAQRQAELKDLAEYRQRHLQAIKDWSIPEKRAAIIARTEAEKQTAVEICKTMPADLIAVRTGHRITPTKIMFKPLPPKPSRWQRFKSWLGFK